MDSETTTRVRENLVTELEEKGRLLMKLKKSVADQARRYQDEGGVFASDMADTASADAEHEADYYLVMNQDEVVREIEEAIRRVDEGSYGLCEQCGSGISPRRLEVLRYARLCLSCQEKSERAASRV